LRLGLGVIDRDTHLEDAVRVGGFDLVLGGASRQGKRAADGFSQRRRRGGLKGVLSLICVLCYRGSLNEARGLLEGCGALHISGRSANET